MTEATDKNRRVSGTLAWICLLLYTVICVVYLPRADWNLDWDGSVYVLAAQSLEAGEGYAYQGKPFFLRPPGMSFLLTFFLDDDGFRPLAVNLFLLFCAGTSLAALFLLLRSLHGGWIALAVTLLTGTSALYTHIFNYMHAEYPFFTLLFGGLWLLGPGPDSDRERGRSSRVRMVAGVACLAGAIYLRTAAILILPGLALTSLLRGKGRRRLTGLLPVLLIGLLALPWIVHSRDAARQAEVPVEQDLQYDYATALLRVDPGNPDSELVDLDGWLARIHGHGAFLLEELTLTTFHLYSDRPLVRLGLLAWILLGLLLALRRGSLTLETFALLHSLVVVAYFAYGARLAVPLVPLVYLYLALPVAGLLRWMLRRRGPLGRPEPWTMLAVALFALLFSANLRSFAGHFEQTPGRDGETRELAEWVRQNLPEDAVLLCNQAPTMALLTGRQAYTFRFPRGDDLIDKYGVDHVVLDDHGHPEFIRQVRDRTRQAWPITVSSGRMFYVFRVD